MINNSFKFLTSFALFGMFTPNVIDATYALAYGFEEFTMETTSHAVTTEELLIEAITSPASGSAFGLNVDISGDYIIAGAYKDDVTFTNNYGTYTYSAAGSAYLFEVDTDANGDVRGYTELGKMDATFGSDDDGDALPNDYFGSDVAISSGYLDSDGIVRMIIGAKQGASFDKGLAFVFEYDINSGEFTKTAKLSASDSSTYSYFGSSVDISDSGDYIIIGAWGNNNENGNYAGAAYIFEYDNDNSEWIETTKLLSDDGVTTDYFGKSVGINDQFAIVGSGSCGGNNAGAAYVFANNNDDSGSWTQTQKLEASDAGSYDYFGESVAISNSDSNIIIIGADSYDPLNTEDYTYIIDAGAAYIFEYDEINYEWEETAIVYASDAENTDLFGNSVDISSDGSSVIIGARYKDSNGLTNSGAAYIFESDDDGEEWVNVLTLINNDASENNAFGTDVAISDNWAVVGKSTSNDNNELYLFDY